MSSKFRMQIIDTHDGAVVEFEPGKSVEMAFIKDIVDKLSEKRIGFFTTKHKVREAVTVSLQEAIFELKKQVKANH